MDSENQKNRPVLLIAFTILFVIILSHFLGGVSIFGYKIKPVDLFMDIKPDSLISSEYNTHLNLNGDIAVKNKPEDKDKTISLGSLKFNPEYVKSAISARLLEKLFDKKSDVNEVNYAVNYYGQIKIKDVPLSGDTDQMKYFFEALKKTGSEKIRIAHYGDSGVEGDNITSSIRYEFQKQFGGNGVGFLSITSQDIMFRMTTKQSFSDNWKTISVLTGNPDNIPLGINGFTAIPQGASWVKYQTTSSLPYLKSFGIVRLFYSNAKNQAIKYQFNGGEEETAFLKTGTGVNELELKAPGGNAKSVKIIAAAADQADFYGASLENGNGVYVDNFPWRGNTGLGFNKIAESQFVQFGKLLNYKLIILEFGANETSFGSSDNTWYENQMVKVINNLKKAFPNTSILLLGVGDRAVKRGTRFVTDPNIPLLLKTQEKIAARTGVAFWNLFEAMGGYNSMEAWVHANPPLALMDYTHPSMQGAAKMGQMIAGAIIRAYKQYK